ncbi:MAG: threonine synthase [Candidatus Latescibacterota bacterium]|nr:MAG: threonine synthase [Candidatus Latescibacterota bacterium]
MSYLTHLECGLCRQSYDADTLQALCPDCSRPLLARYDLDAARRELDRDVISTRPDDLWRYREFLPIRDPRFALNLGEGFTPLHHATRLGKELDFADLFIKDEGNNPTGSFKARGLGVAVSRAFELGVTSVSVPSAGNAACAMCAYAAFAGIEAHAYMPTDVPPPFIAECQALGATVTLVDGVITDCGKAAVADAEKYGRFDLSTLKEPYRLEGKKTMGYEVAEQMGWTLPDVMIYPTGGGTGLVGMWKAFDELEHMGWIGSKRPRMVTVQSSGCAPMVKAFEGGEEFAEFWHDAATVADGLRVPAAVGDFLILRALRESSGTAVSVSDEEMIDAANTIGRTQGFFVAPESGATLAAFNHLRKSGWIDDGESVVLFSTGNGAKYAHLWRDDQ